MANWNKPAYKRQDILLYLQLLAAIRMLWFTNLTRSLLAIQTREKILKIFKNIIYNLPVCKIICRNKKDWKPDSKKTPFKNSPLSIQASQKDTCGENNFAVQCYRTEHQTALSIHEGSLNEPRIPSFVRHIAYNMCNRNTRNPQLNKSC